MRYVLLVLFVAGSMALFAQEDVEVAVPPSPSYDSARSQYIKTFPEHFFLWPVLKQRRLDFEMKSLRNKDYSLTYKSNKPYSFGLGMYLFELAVEVAFALPVDDNTRRIYGESDASDLQLNIIGKKWGIDAFIQKYEGFYIEDPNVKVPANMPYPQRADIVTKNIGVGLNYTFNNKKFSFRSAYNFSDQQLRSEGSFLIFGNLSGFRARGDSALAGENYRTEFESESQIKEIKVTTLGIAPGYTYSLIFKGFFLNGTLAVGPAHNWLAYTLDDGVSKNDIRFNVYVAARIGLGYNGDRIFGGLSFISQNRTAKFDNVELINSSGTFKMLIGYRFREFGILKHRVWDLPKKLIN